MHNQPVTTTALRSVSFKPCCSDLVRPVGYANSLGRGNWSTSIRALWQET